MKISTKGRYSLEVMLFLASYGKSCSCTTIGSATGISAGYLEQLMIPLKKANLVVAKRGVEGGYRVSREDITCYDVLNASEGDCKLPCPHCLRKQDCATERFWQDLVDSKASSYEI